ncbi:hypothetical protein BKA82DRAFT_1009444 [Pisolithus tinctorius]|uniref:Uncharacterized protein n=1 Tax=Pisolithus tinctorius Marx 270 TaxID=870435 RepID=A0A0C3NAR5_PISTI|nr:hypothetical protein BKA82DRAFT_1009444 [Pisolithus tinctorius]KIN92658.1 hypothetical protein M404DRAFT_1009444 [Pisolithus tinctorius Marx 270]
MENGVATDKVYLAGEFAQEKSAVAENLKKEFSHKGCVLRLERRQVCSTCGEVDHIQSACGLRLRLQSPDMQEWAFVPVGILTRPADKPVKETGGKEQEMNPASGSKTRALVDGDKSGAPKLPSDNNRPAKKRKGNNKGKKGKN